MSRKIKLKRKENFRYGVPAEFLRERVIDVGSYYSGQGPARALTYEQENLWMPMLINLDAKDPGFRTAITNYYKNLSIKIDVNGMQLEIGLDENGTPYNLEDYIKYLIAKKHPWMALNKEQCYSSEHLQFYFEDIAAEEEKQSKNLENSTKAYVEFAKLAEEEDKLDWVLRTVISKYPQVGIFSEIVKLKLEKKKLKLSQVIEKDPEYFLEAVNDKDLIYKAEITSMVDAGVLTKEGNRFLNGSENLGSLDGVIAWMKDGNNSGDYAILKARLEQFGTPIVTKQKQKTK